MIPSCRLAAKLAAGCALAVSACAALAQQIAPVLVELSAARRVVSVTVSNRSGQPMTLQSQVLAWDQADGADRYAETADLMVVPPLATVAAGKSQIFRVALRRAPASEELAYRLILQDVTAETSPQQRGDGNAAVRIQFRHSLPVFVKAAGRTAAAPRLEPCTPSRAQELCFRMNNAGGERVRISKLAGEGSGWRRDLAPGTVLAGRSREWRFEPGAPGAATVTAETTAGTFSLRLPSGAQ